MSTSSPLFRKQPPERGPGHFDEELTGLGAFVRLGSVDAVLA